VRDANALFCPECGKPMRQQATPPLETQSKPEESVAVPAADKQSTRAEHQPSAAEKPNETRPAKTGANEKSPGAINPSAAAGADVDAHHRGDKTRERLHRASEVARGLTRGVIEEPAKRVEKIRQASHVMIEEASYDTSLRFVLVAVGLFVVFVILLVVSKVMG
jgi:hypothetical protein